MQKYKGVAVALVFIVWIFGIFLAYFIIPQKEFSEIENRYLAALPRPTLKTLINGSFSLDVDSYLNDHIAGRDAFMQLNTAYTYAFGMREQNGVYFSLSDTYIQKFAPTDTANANKNSKAVRDFADSVDIPVYFALIPTSAGIYPNLLPYGAPNINQKALIEKLYGIAGGGIDTFSPLSEHRGEYIFYNTDHHWTSLGAYYGYAACVRAMGEYALPLSQYNKTVLSCDFYGTLYSKAPAWWIKEDEIWSFVPESGTKVTVYDGHETVQKELYAKENLNKKDKYTVFLGENQPLVRIDYNSGGKNLLILKDSYMNSAAPFFTRNFSSVHLIDPRYYKTSIGDYIYKNDIDMILICYNISNFLEDTNLQYLLKKH